MIPVLVTWLSFLIFWCSCCSWCWCWILGDDDDELWCSGWCWWQVLMLLVTMMMTMCAQWHRANTSCCWQSTHRNQIYFVFSRQLPTVCRVQLPTVCRVQFNCNIHSAQTSPLKMHGGRKKLYHRCPFHLEQLVIFSWYPWRTSANLKRLQHIPLKMSVFWS